jgi:hypothetical protein
MGSFNLLRSLAHPISIRRGNPRSLLKPRTTPRITVQPPLTSPASSHPPSRNHNSAETLIHADLELLPIEKWGWLIYRCTYTSDAAWSRFRSAVEAQSRAQTAASDAPEIADRLEWTCVEDPATLDGISTVALRERFRAWVAGDVARQGLEEYDPTTIARYSYFVKVDEEVMQNLGGFLAADSYWAKGDFVKFVDANWEPATVREEDEEWCEPNFYEEIEVCTEEDVGWMRISPFMINTAFYETLNGDNMAWELFYSRPPHIVLW